MKKATVEKVEKMAQDYTLLIAQSGVSKEVAFGIVVNMLLYHSGLVMAEAQHKVFMDDFSELLKRTLAEVAAVEKDDEGEPLVGEGHG
jgi:hypothetical protein